eukprot:6485702-Amphidinium_carterae.1
MKETTETGKGSIRISKSVVVDGLDQLRLGSLTSCAVSFVQIQCTRRARTCKNNTMTKNH